MGEGKVRVQTRTGEGCEGCEGTSTRACRKNKKNARFVFSFFYTREWKTPFYPHIPHLRHFYPHPTLTSLTCAWLRYSDLFFPGFTRGCFVPHRASQGMAPRNECAISPRKHQEETCVMADYTVDPDPDQPTRPALRRPPQVVAPAVLPAYRPCQVCGTPTLTGITRSGEEVTIEPSWECFVIFWQEKATVPRLDPSRAYPRHRCTPIPTKETV